MAKVKYYAKENSSIGTHSFYAERCQRTEPTGLHGSRQVLCKQSGIAERSRQFSDEVSWQKVDPTAAAAASGEEDITEGGDNQGGNQGGGTTGGELEG